MMSDKLRNVLNVVALLAIIGGPLLAILGFAASVLLGEERIGLALGSAIQLSFGSMLAGGVLRALTSLDARQEARVSAPFGDAE